MANYAADYTSRAQLHLTGPAGDHRLLFRFGTTSDPATILAKVNFILGDLAPLTDNNATYDGLELAPVGSSTFIPVSGFTPVNGSSGNDYSDATEPAGFYVQIPFASSGGSNYSIYCYYGLVAFNGRMQFAAGTLYTDYAGVAAQMITQGCTAIDRNPITFRGHVNVGINDEVTHKRRRL